jgi:uncharacterized protein YbjT (DUF2867 family)
VTKPILVAGAAGAVGHAVCDQLVKRGCNVRAMVRKADDRSARLAERGVEIAIGDLLDLHAAHRAIEGCDRLYFGMSVSPSYLEATINAAAVAQQIRLPFGRGKISPIASADVARVIATVLEAPADHIGKIYELTGLRSQDMDEIAEEFSGALGQTITYVDVPWEPWRKALEDSGMLTPHVLAHLATMALLIQQNRYDRLTSDVEHVSKTPPLSVREFVQQHAQAYRAET